MRYCMLVAFFVGLSALTCLAQRVETPPVAEGIQFQQGSSTDAQEIPYLRRRADFTTKLMRHGSSPHVGAEPKVLAGYQKVLYRSGDLQLKAWVSLPPQRRPSRLPAVVHFHGGFGLSLGHFHTCKPFQNAGFVVMLPALRGENGNPGDYELWLSEVDDAIAAVNWLRRQRFVDPRRIYAFGHSAGGVISSLLSLMKDVPIQHSGSCGGLYTPNQVLLLKERVPFDVSNPIEPQLRVLPGNIRWMQRTHYAYYGDKDYSVLNAVRAAKKEMEGLSDTKLKLQEVAGNHLESLTPAMEAYIALIQADN